MSCTPCKEDKLNLRKSLCRCIINGHWKGLRVIFISFCTARYRCIVSCCRISRGNLPKRILDGYMTRMAQKAAENRECISSINRDQAWLSLSAPDALGTGTIEGKKAFRVMPSVQNSIKSIKTKKTKTCNRNYASL